MPREYEPAWVALKTKGRVKLKVAPHLWQRVKKAVIKEKDKDLVFKFENGVDKRRIVVTYDPVKQELVFVLEAKFGIT